MAHIPYNVIGGSTNHIIDSYCSEYARHYGRDKLLKVFEKVRDSNKLSELDGRSIRFQVAPTAHDFCATINGIVWFMFKDQKTIGLATLIAIKLWDERVNSVYHFCTEIEVRQKIMSVFEILNL